MASKVAQQTKAAVAVVTGSNTGIGYEIARGLAGSLPTILTSRNDERGRRALQSLREEGENLDLHYHQLDIDDPESVDRFVGYVRDTFGGVRVLVNNAAIAFKGSDPTPFEGQTEPTLRTNVYSTISFTEKMVPLLQNQNDTRIVFMASQAGTSALRSSSRSLQDRWMSDTLGKDGIFELLDAFKASVRAGTHLADGWANTNYGMSKLAVIAAARSFGRDLATEGITVTSCCPGYCKTNMSSHRGNRSAAKGAETPIWLSLCDSSATPPGSFWYDKERIL